MRLKCVVEYDELKEEDGMENQARLKHIFLNALVDGCTGAALFRRLRWAGAPKELIDPRTVDEYLRSEDARADSLSVEPFRVSPRKPTIKHSSQEFHPGNVS